MQKGFRAVLNLLDILKITETKTVSGIHPVVWMHLFSPTQLHDNTTTFLSSTAMCQANYSC